MDEDHHGNLVERPERFVSHALAELRKYSWLPFGVHSALLLDISTTGFKIELTDEYFITPGQDYWLTVPLVPLGIPAPSRFQSKVHIKWFDEAKFRAGGTFIKMDPDSEKIIVRIVEILKDRGLGTP